MRTREENNAYMRKYRFGKKLTKIRANERCHYCGEKAETIHHIDENQQNNRFQNLIPLCNKCHLEIRHQCDKPGYYANLLSDRPKMPLKCPQLRVTRPKWTADYLNSCNTNRFYNLTIRKPNTYKIIYIISGSRHLIELLASLGFTEIER